MSLSTRRDCCGFEFEVVLSAKREGDGMSDVHVVEFEEVCCLEWSEDAHRDDRGFGRKLKSIPDLWLHSGRRLSRWY